MLLASLSNYWSLKSGKLHKIMCGHDFPDMSVRLVHTFISGKLVHHFKSSHYCSTMRL